MKILQLFNCMRGKHLRSRRLAHEEEGIMRSRCVGCGKAMTRGVRGWQLASLSDGMRIRGSSDT